MRTGRSAMASTHRNTDGLERRDMRGSMPERHSCDYPISCIVRSMVNRIALVRRPSPRLHEGIVAHIERVPVDYGLAVKQWDEYAALLRRYGWDTVEVERADDCPDGVFVE